MQNNVIPGAVGLIASPDRDDWTGTFGTGTLGAEDPMSVDDHFRNAGLLSRCGSAPAPTRGELAWMPLQRADRACRSYRR